jgi:hypothetical protein
VTTSWGAGSGQAARFTATSSAWRKLTPECSGSSPPSHLTPPRSYRPGSFSNRSRQDVISGGGAGRMATAPTSAGKYATAQRRTLLCKSSNGREDARPASAFRHDPSSRHRSCPRSPSTSGGPRSRSLCARLVLPGEELERPASLRLGITVGVELVLDQQGPEGIPRFDRFVGVELDR